MTKLTKLIGLIAMLSLWTTPAKAEFILIAEDNYGHYSYIDDRIHYNGPFVWFIVRNVHRDNSDNIIYHSQTLFSGDCRTGAIRMRKLWTFTLDYQSVNTVNDLGDNEPLSYPPPDSFGYAALSYACNN